MMKEQIDSNGVVYPAYGSFNDNDYKKIQPRDALPLIYVVKANAALNSKIYGNCYSRISTGRVKFLIKDSQAKTALMDTDKGRKMVMSERFHYMAPYELTTKLFEEISNQKMKNSGSSREIILESINTSATKDKFSSFIYGLWRIKELEDELTKKQRRGTKRKLLFFSEGGSR